jgi:transcriptional regulator with XRE-family HTH domain
MSNFDSEINPVAYWRAKRDWTVEFLAKKAGIGKATLTRIENWKVRPELRTLIKLADALEIDLKEIAGLANLPKDLPVKSNQPGTGSITNSWDCGSQLLIN